MQSNLAGFKVNWAAGKSDARNSLQLDQHGKNAACYLLESPVANRQSLLTTVVGHEAVAVGVADTPTPLTLVSCSKQIRSRSVFVFYSFPFSKCRTSGRSVSGWRTPITTLYHYCVVASNPGSPFQICLAALENSIQDFVSQLWRKILSPKWDKLRDKIQNGNPGFEGRLTLLTTESFLKGGCHLRHTSAQKLNHEDP